MPYQPRPPRLQLPRLPKAGVVPSLETIPDTPPTLAPPSTPIEIVRSYLTTRRRLAEGSDFAIDQGVAFMPLRGTAWLLTGDDPGVDMVNRAVLSESYPIVVGIRSWVLQENPYKALDQAWEGRDV